MSSNVLATALHADGPAPDRSEKMALYGWLVGRWDFDVAAFDANGTRYSSEGEIYAGWVLEGRAVQDVWTIPPRSRRTAALRVQDFPVTGPWYGTTLRIYDPAIDAWHIHWLDPATGFQAHMIGRASGADIVQEGALEPGVRLRWGFHDVRPAAFRWTGEVSRDGGKSWHLQVDIAARRSG